MQTISTWVHCIWNLKVPQDRCLRWGHLDPHPPSCTSALQLSKAGEKLCRSGAWQTLGGDEDFLAVACPFIGWTNAIITFSPCNQTRYGRFISAFDSFDSVVVGQVQHGYSAGGRKLSTLGEALYIPPAGASYV